MKASGPNLKVPVLLP